MLTDLLLAIGHHILIFSLAGILAAEIVLIRPNMSPADLARAGWLDLSYGIIAGLIVIVGFGRVFFGIKGPDFYLSNPVFWAKIAALVVVGLLSIKPTVAILHWRNQAKASPEYVPPPSEIEAARRYMRLEAGVFVLIPVFAAMMARGYGL
jgi:putative membrane protein